jgi:methionyl-tRNA formyltransferase
MDGTLVPKEQEGEASVCKKITKELGEITLATNGAEVQRKFRALTPWPSVYFFHDHKGKSIRVKVTGVDLLVTDQKRLSQKISLPKSSQKESTKYLLRNLQKGTYKTKTGRGRLLF